MPITSSAIPPLLQSGCSSQPEYEDLVAASPCDRIRAKDLIGEKKIRQRVLDDAELRALWAADRASLSLGTVYWLLLLTGSRRTEATDVRWGEFDLEARDGRYPSEVQE